MVLQLFINDTGHFFYDTEVGVQVGQAYQKRDGSWSVEVNDNTLSAPDLESAKRLFVTHYDPSLVISLGAFDFVGDESEDDESEDEIDESGFEVIDLTDD